MRPIDANALKEDLKDPPLHLSLGGMSMRDVLQLIDYAPTIDVELKWIPCSERLPELKTKCLITYLSWSGSPVIDIDSYDYDGEDGWFSHMDKVIAWMPLPEPFAERSK